MSRDKLTPMEYGWDSRDYWIRERRRMRQRAALKRPGDPYLAPDWVLRGDPDDPTSWATLDLDFVYDRGYDGVEREESTASELLTCTRNSVGTYTTRNGRILHFTANQLRIGNRGVLVEESRVNSFLQSQTFGTTWTATNVSVNSNAAVAPDGTTTADEIVEDTDTDNHGVEQSPTIAGGVQVAASVYVKRGVGNRHLCIQLVSQGGADIITAYYDLTFAEVGTTVEAGDGVIDSSSIEELADGWFRCILVGTPSPTNSLTAGTARIFMSSDTTNGSQTYDGDTTSSLYIWGAQLEAGSFPTSYIPTVASAVTREADIVTVTSPTFINNSAGTIFTHSEWNEIVGFSAAPASISDGTGNNFIYPYCFQNGVGMAVRTGGVDQVSTAVTTVAVGESYKAAMAYATNDFAASFKGAAVATDTSGALGTYTTFGIGNRDGVTGERSQYIARVSYWNTNLADAALEALAGVPAWLLDYEVELDFDFENDLGWLSGALVDLDSVLTCSRNHISYYTNKDGTLTSVAANTLRTGTNGLLVEEARTNNFIRSQDLTTDWGIGGATVDANAVEALDGTTTADTVIEDTSTGTHTANISFVAAGASTWSISAYVKAAGRTRFRTSVTDNAVASFESYFDLSTGEVAVAPPSSSGNWTDISASIVPLADGWYRINHTATLSTSATIAIQFALVNSGTTISYEGDGTSGMTIWGLQGEAGAFPTSYIPTTTVAVTRPAEVVALSSVDFFNPAANTIYSEFSSDGFSIGSPVYEFAAASRADALAALYFGNSTNLLFEVYGTAFSLQSNWSDAVVLGETYSHAVALAQNDFAASLDGASVHTDAAGVWPAATITQCNLGSFTPGSPNLNGHIPRFTSWRQRKVNAHLELITK